VDTKYEFGMGENDEIVLIDEIHTPDSSRFRQYKDEKLPDAPAELVDELSRRYIQMYEQITGEKFVCGEKPIGQRILQTFCVCFAIQRIIAPWARRAC
jgi:phosphoribosylaminoimidazole-succinocarboxamide synthase